MQVYDVEFIKKTEKLVFFKVRYTERAFVVFDRKSCDTVYVSANVKKGIASTIYEYKGDNKWWREPNAWQAVHSWVHMNDIEELKAVLNI